MKEVIAAKNTAQTTFGCLKLSLKLILELDEIFLTSY
jgi:hypothetical protein